MATGTLNEIFTGPLEKHYRLGKMGGVLALSQPTDMWNYQWKYSIARHHGLYIVPTVNLVDNIGLGHDSTHTYDGADMMGTAPAYDQTFALQHPDRVAQDRLRDNQRFNEFLLSRVAAVIRRKFTRQRPAAGSDALHPTPLLGAAFKHLVVSFLLTSIGK